jgi:hypothetical protein
VSIEFVSLLPRSYSELYNNQTKLLKLFNGFSKSRKKFQLVSFVIAAVVSNYAVISKYLFNFPTFYSHHLNPTKSSTGKMSAQARPISPTRFAEALHDLPLSNLYGKVAELRNQLVHLDYSNQEMQAFAEGTAPGLTEPDKDCITAIEENEIVIKRIVERLGLLRAEIEGRGNSWLDGRGEEEQALANGHASDAERRAIADEPIVVNEEAPQGWSEAWRDGTFSSGSIVNGEVVMDAPGTVPGRAGEAQLQENQSGANRAAREPGTTENDEAEDEGLHL